MRQFKVRFRTTLWLVSMPIYRQSCGLFKPGFRTVWGLNSEPNSEPSYSPCMALLAALVGLVLWPDYGLVVDSLETRLGGCFMFGLWHACVACYG